MTTKERVTIAIINIDQSYCTCIIT